MKVNHTVVPSYYRVLTMVYYTQIYWVFGLCPSSGFFLNSKGKTQQSRCLPSPEDGNRSSFRNGVFFLCYLGKVRTMDKVRKPNISVYSCSCSGVLPWWRMGKWTCGSTHFYCKLSNWKQWIRYDSYMISKPIETVRMKCNGSSRLLRIFSDVISATEVTHHTCMLNWKGYVLR
jgi:hypothetical protein